MDELSEWPEVTAPGSGGDYLFIKCIHVMPSGARWVVALRKRLYWQRWLTVALAVMPNTVKEFDPETYNIVVEYRKPVRRWGKFRFLHVGPRPDIMYVPKEVRAWLRDNHKTLAVIARLEGESLHPT